MKYRKLRIAWSVVMGVLCLTMIAACFALQYGGANVELVRRAASGLTDVRIYDGNLSLSWEPRVPYRPEWAGQVSRHGFRHSVYSDGSWNLSVPLGVVGTLHAVMIVFLSALPWIRYHFGLRTLLTAMTLVAVGLGWIVYAIR
jgi:hypothetical protein